MRQRIQFAEKARYTRIVARIPADLQRACSRLSEKQDWTWNSGPACWESLG